MEEKKKNVFELLIFAVILLAVIIYYGVNKSGNKNSNNIDENVKAEQTISPETTGNTQISPNETLMPDMTGNMSMPEAQTSNGGAISAKSNEYHSETEEGE